MNGLLDLLGQPWAQRFVESLAHFVWQGTLIGVGLALVMSVIRPRSASVRYVLFSTAMVLMAACPVLTWMVIEPADDLVAETTEREALPPNASPAALVAMQQLYDSQIEVETQPEARESGAFASWIQDPRIQSAWKQSQPILLVCWLFGITLLSLRLIAAWWMTRWLCRGGQPIPKKLDPLVRKLKLRLGCTRQALRIATSTQVRQAMVVGIFRPLILLPDTWVAGMSSETLQAVIAHELAHIRRLDLWVNLLQRLVEMLLFFHPVVWWVSRRMREEREMCCDEMAVAAIGDRVVYVNALSFAAQLKLKTHQPSLASSFRGGTKMMLLNRVRNVLGVNHDPSSSRWWPIGLVILILSVGCWAAVSGFQPNRADASLSTGTVQEKESSSEEAIWRLFVEQRDDAASKPQKGKSDEFDSAVQWLLAARESNPQGQDELSVWQIMSRQQPDNATALIWQTLSDQEGNEAAEVLWEVLLEEHATDETKEQSDQEKTQQYEAAVEQALRFLVEQKQSEQTEPEATLFELLVEKTAEQQKDRPGGGPAREEAIELWEEATQAEGMARYLLELSNVDPASSNSGASSDDQRELIQAIHQLKKEIQLLRQEMQRRRDHGQSKQIDGTREALEAYLRGVEVWKQGQAEEYRRRGIELFKEGRQDKARDAYRKALEQYLREGRSQQSREKAFEDEAKDRYREAFEFYLKERAGKGGDRKKKAEALFYDYLELNPEKKGDKSAKDSKREVVDQFYDWNLLLELRDDSDSKKKGAAEWEFLFKDDLLKGASDQKKKSTTPSDFTDAFDFLENTKTPAEIDGTELDFTPIPSAESLLKPEQNEH